MRLQPLRYGDVKCALTHCQSERPRHDERNQQDARESETSEKASGRDAVRERQADMTDEAEQQCVS
jgi:hypothetical protein